MRSRMSGSIGGSPGWPLVRYVHFFRTSARCQRSRVSGRTTNEDQLLFVIARLAAANRTRSRRLSRGRFTCRCSTFSWCRSTRSSMSRSSARRPPTPRRRQTRKYRSENSMELLPVEGAHATGPAPRIQKTEPFTRRCVWSRTCCAPASKGATSGDGLSRHRPRFSSTRITQTPRSRRKSCGRGRISTDGYRQGGRYLVCRVQSALTKPRQVGQDLVGGLGPDERLRVLVVDVEVAEDGRLELGGAAMRAAADLLLGEEREEALDEVDPGRSGRCEVEMVARVS